MEKVEESTDNGDDLNVHHNTYKRRGHELGSDCWYYAKNATRRFTTRNNGKFSWVRIIQTEPF